MATTVNTLNSIMITFTPDAVSKCFSRVVADVNKMNDSSVTAWFKSTFPEVTQIASQNPGLFNPVLANSNITAIPRKPIKSNRNVKEYFSEANEYNSAISKITVAFTIDVRAAMGCAGYSPGQIATALKGFYLQPVTAGYK